MSSIDSNSIYRDSFSLKIDSDYLKCDVILLETGISFLEFEYNNNYYLPFIFHYRSKLNKILSLYIIETNDKSFGTVEDDNIINITLEDKKKFTLKVAKDFMKCFSNLMETKRKEVISYCAYYYLNKKEDTYSNYIEDIVCQFICEKKILCKGTRFHIYDWKSTSVEDIKI